MSPITDERTKPEEPICRNAQLFSRGNSWCGITAKGEVRPGQGKCCRLECDSYVALREGEVQQRFVPSNRTKRSGITSRREGAGEGMAESGRGSSELLPSVCISKGDGGVGKGDPQKAVNGANVSTGQPIRPKLPASQKGQIRWNTPVDSSLLDKSWPRPPAGERMTWGEYTCFMRRMVLVKEFADRFRVSEAAVEQARLCRKGYKPPPILAQSAPADPLSVPASPLEQLLALGHDHELFRVQLQSFDPEELLAQIPHAVLAGYVAISADRLYDFFRFTLAKMAEAHRAGEEK